MPFCSNCGAKVKGGSFCTRCGSPVQAPSQPMNTTPMSPNPQPPFQTVSSAILLQTLSQKVKTEAIIWVIIASLQAVIGVIALVNVLDGETSLSGLAWLLAVSVLNFVVASKDFKYSREVLTNPVGIVAKFQPVGGLIITLIYNLLFGGMIGVVGTVFGFVTRSYVMNNMQWFLQIEANYQRNACTQNMN